MKPKDLDYYKGFRLEEGSLSHIFSLLMMFYFWLGSVRESQNLKEILDLYFVATGMEINMGKSALYTYGLNDSLSTRIERIFSFQHLDFEGGLKYLGFILKPNNYGNKDWRWLMSRIEQRISFWCNRWISRGGRLVLIKYVLEAIPILWHTLAHIPKGILEKVRKCCFNYLWKGSSEFC
jgi:hypothetical protein